MKPIYTTIPVMLCQYALVHRKGNHLLLYIYLKQISNGYISYNPNQLDAWATDIGKSKRWVQGALKWLIKNKWITVNNKRQVYKISSYKELCYKLNVLPYSAVIFEDDDYTSFRNFCCAVVIIYYLKLKIRTDKKNQSVSNLVDPIVKNWDFYSKGFHPMPISYIAKRLGVSNSTANKLKQSAIKSGLVICKSNIPFMQNVFGEKLGIEHLPSLKKSCPEISGRLRTNGKYIKIVESDILMALIKTKRKRYKFNEKK
jgi:hypothetical protein